MKPIHLYQAWKILPWTAKGLLVLGYGVSGIVYWAGTHADPRYGCLTDICDVTRQGIQQTIFFGQGLIVLCSLILVFCLVTVGITLDKQEAKGKTFEEMNQKIHGIEKQAVHDTIYYKIWRFLVRTYLVLILGIGLDGLSVNAILANPDLAGEIIISWGFVGIGLTLVGIGMAVIKSQEGKPKSEPPNFS